VRKPFLELTEDDYSSALKSQGCVLSNISSPGLHFRAFEI
jgi:hypothetical protein